jgi:serine phosphatase RsbU (regulator of sigma subunit)
MFGDTTYLPQTERLAAGDRLIIVSDGVYDTRSGERNYAEHAMPRVLGTSRALTPPEAVRAVLSDLAVFRGAGEVDDDVVVVCLDWR